MIVLEIISFLVVAYASYYCFENYGFKQAIIFNTIFLFVIAIIGGIMTGKTDFLNIVVQPLVSGIISTLACNFVFEKSNSLISYFIILIIIILAITILPGFIITKSAQMVL